MHAKLAESPRAAVRNLAYLLNDLADPVLHAHAAVWLEQTPIRFSGIRSAVST